jgi:hypothetical protein
VALRLQQAAQQLAFNVCDIDAGQGTLQLQGAEVQEE